MLPILDRGLTCRVNVEVVAELPRGRIYEDRVAAAALHETGAALVEEVTLSVGPTHRATDEAGVIARTRDRLGGVKLEPATDFFSGLNRHY